MKITMVYPYNTWFRVFEWLFENVDDDKWRTIVDANHIHSTLAPEWFVEKEAARWRETNLKKLNRTNNVGGTIQFEDKVDAMAFKLRWV